MTNPSDFSQVLERLLCSLVDDKRAVSVDYSELPARVNWSFICDINDIPKVVGKGGSRLRELRLILELVGQQSGNVQWYLEQPNELPGERRNTKHYPEIPEFHNPYPDLELLGDILAPLGIKSAIGVSGDLNSGFTFSIQPRQIQDATALIEPHEASYSAHQRLTEPLTLSACIVDLMRAIGAVQGVKYFVRVE